MFSLPVHILEIVKSGFGAAKTKVSGTVKILFCNGMGRPEEGISPCLGHIHRGIACNS
jgi:hypothetical protein